MRTANTAGPGRTAGRVHGRHDGGLRVLGVDPGSRVTGYGVVECTASAGRDPDEGGAARSLRHVAHGTLRPPDGASLAERLGFLYEGIAEIIDRHAPGQVVVEQVFVSTSVRSALVLGQARGAVLAAAGGAGLGVDELSARQVKKAVVGTGAATKGQVQAMVSRLLGLDRHPAQDAADALAAAICRAHAGAGPLQALGLRGSRGGRRRRSPRPGRFVMRRQP